MASCLVSGEPSPRERALPRRLNVRSTTRLSSKYYIADINVVSGTHESQATALIIHLRTPLGSGYWLGSR